MCKAPHGVYVKDCYGPAECEPGRCPSPQLASYQADLQAERRAAAALRAESDKVAAALQVGVRVWGMGDALSGGIAYRCGCSSCRV